MNKKFFRSQEKKILLVLSGLIGTMFLWAGGIGASRMFSGLPTSSTLTIFCCVVGVLLVTFVSSYAASNVRDDDDK